ncbi:MAG: hypothetical protein QN172_02550 [Armatimonadota bacterium]|nr:hypothetical protein [Armatimonadota bacterium]MDR7439658.1 hypothetical protein [Armatimonadota bacterium]MDR7566744.1 hypothetical protein [Armatimonadota bacterium]MDR7601320.1 hypothetical protein [Armatimonadota bacterium]
MADAQSVHLLWQAARLLLREGAAPFRALGRVKYQRPAAVDGPAGYRNGCGRPRKLLTPAGAVTLRRGCGAWRSRAAAASYPLFARRTKAVSVT